MYVPMIVVLLGALPLSSIAIELWVLHSNSDLLALIGKWFTFWPIGVRLTLAGARQVFNPGFTAKTIFETEDAGARTIVQELGFGNLAIGSLGALTLFAPTLIPGAAFAGGLFYGLAGAKHALARGRNELRQAAMISDLAIFAVLALYLALMFASGRLFET